MYSMLNFLRRNKYMLLRYVFWTMDVDESNLDSIRITQFGVLFTFEGGTPFYRNNWLMLDVMNYQKTFQKPIKFFRCKLVYLPGNEK